MARWALDAPKLSCAINVTAPEPVTNRTFARELGRALHRPAFMPAPALALRLALGEMAGALLLSGQRAVPDHAERLGFTFRYRELPAALAAIFWAVSSFRSSVFGCRSSASVSVFGLRLSVFNRQPTTDNRRPTTHSIRREAPQRVGDLVGVRAGWRSRGRARTAHACPDR